MILKKQHKRRIIAVSKFKTKLSDLLIIYYRGKDGKITYTPISKNIDKELRKLLKNQLFIKLCENSAKRELVYVSILDMINHLNISVSSRCEDSKGMLMKLEDQPSGETITSCFHNNFSKENVINSIRNSNIYKKLPIEKKLLFELKML